VKLLDFGIAKAVDEDHSLTATGHMPGTPAYMAPELVEGAAEIDGRADLFSVGVLLYELILRTRPFRGMTFFEITNRIFDNDFDPPRKVDPHLPQLLENLILIAMAHRPQDRFPSAAKMRAVLHSAAKVALQYTPRPIEQQASDGRSPAPTLTDYVKSSLPRRRR
jgi:serine/threonine-protein kinase